MPAFNYSMYLYERDLKFQEKCKYLVKAVLHEHRKNHLSYKPPLAIQHFPKSFVLICLLWLPSDNLSLPAISILKIKGFTLIISQAAIKKKKKIRILQQSQLNTDRQDMRKSRKLIFSTCHILIKYCQSQSSY